jgi:hypothetical protein
MAITAGRTPAVRTKLFKDSRMFTILSTSSSGELASRSSSVN